MSAHLPDFNRLAALDRVGGDEELLREVVELFLVEHPHLMRDVEDAVQHKDAARLERAAHTLKGSLSTIGAEGAARAALQLEIAGRSGQIDGVGPQLEQLGQALGRLCGQLEGVRRG
jgi:HPt (histidine-containing phosphotransfer) domain-containing protein